MIQKIPDTSIGINIVININDPVDISINMNVKSGTARAQGQEVSLRAAGAVLSVLCSTPVTRERQEVTNKYYLKVVTCHAK